MFGSLKIRLKNIEKGILPFFPLLIFAVMVLLQAFFHYGKWQEDKSKYVLKGLYSEINSDTLKKLNIRITSSGEAFLLADLGWDLMWKGYLPKELSDLRFEKQETLIEHTGPDNVSRAAILVSQRLLNYKILVGLNSDGTERYCLEPESFKILFSLKNPLVADVARLAGRFACDCNGYDYRTINIADLKWQERRDYMNSYVTFWREVLKSHKPVRIPDRTNLSFSDFLQYVMFNNMTMNSPNLISRLYSASNWNLFFTLITYFILAVQAGIVGGWYVNFIKK